MVWRETILFGAILLAFLALMGFVVWGKYRETAGLRADCLSAGGMLVEGSCVRCP